MVKWSRNRRTLGCTLGCCLLVVALTLSLLPSGSSAMAAGVPPAMAQGFAEIVKKVTPAVVNIAVTGGGEGGRGRRPLPPGPFGGPPGGEEPPGGELPTPPPMPPPGPHGRPDQSAGSGLILDPNGYIVTNNHVVEGATQITVTLSDRREFSAKIVGTDPKTDLAVIKSRPKTCLPSSGLSTKDCKSVDLVLAVGSPFGLSSTVTLGDHQRLGARAMWASPIMKISFRPMRRSTRGTPGEHWSI
jgi:serine protease Do